MNVNDDDLEPFVDRQPFSSRRKRLVDPAAARIGASVREIAARSAQIPYHFHHLQEELVVLRRGRLVLRTPAGERELREGGERLATQFRLADGVEYLEGE